jgi:hypothetical protein
MLRPGAAVLADDKRVAPLPSGRGLFAMTYERRATQAAGCYKVRS